ncbi:AraC family transcriptional regulator [Ferrovibrio sp.]|uniref:AraC family transcriptional regulator n=1 Tax=Ferrovibrio sp. TaxID=1917215 RepID=UPI00311FFF08
MLTLEGCNEIDSFVAFAMLCRHKAPGWQVRITGPGRSVTSMNGVPVGIQQPLSWLAEADAVLVGSGVKTAQYAADADFLAQLHLDPARQLIGAQCSGSLLLQAKGLLGALPVCSDSMTRPHLEARGVTVLDRPFHAGERIATAGGCLASSYLATWMLARLADAGTAARILHYVAPVGEKDAMVAHVFAATGLTAAQPITPLPAPDVGTGTSARLFSGHGSGRS